MKIEHITGYPEAKFDEFYLGHYTKEQFIKIKHKTKRRGEIIWCNFNKVPWIEHLYWPVFIKKEELEKQGFTFEEAPY